MGYSRREFVQMLIAGLPTTAMMCDLMSGLEGLRQIRFPEGERGTIYL